MNPSCPKARTERQGRILEAFSKLAETSRRGTGSAIGDPEQTSPADHPFRPTGAPELLCSVAVVIAEQARVVKILERPAGQQFSPSQRPEVVSSFVFLDTTGFPKSSDAGSGTPK